MILFRHLILALLFLIAAGFLFFGARRTAENSPANVTVVEYWEKWVGTEADQMRLIVDDFNRTVGADQHIYVRYLSMSKLDQKLLIASAAGVPPDIAGIWDPQTAEFATSAQSSRSMNWRRNMESTSETYKAVYWDSCHYQGKLWALRDHAGVRGHVLATKRSFGRAASTLRRRRPGCGPSAANCFDELDRLRESCSMWFSMQGAESSAGGIFCQWSRAGMSISTPVWFNGSLYDTTTQRFTLDSPENVAAFRNRIASYS